MNAPRLVIVGLALTLLGAGCGDDEDAVTNCAAKSEYGRS